MVTLISFYTGVESHPQYDITGDMKKDNHLDIITASSKHDSIIMIMGYGKGTFSSGTVYSTGDGSHPSAVVWVILTKIIDLI